jgi:hypothetical protein
MATDKRATWRTVRSEPLSCGVGLSAQEGESNG